jgi:hypothetical protein
METHCASCRSDILTPPFYYGEKCSCVYHMDCIDDLRSCVHHAGRVLTCTEDKCIMVNCKFDRAGDASVLCRNCSGQLKLRILKIVEIYNHSTSIPTLFEQIYSINTFWAESVTAVLGSAVRNNGVFRCAVHPIILTSWNYILGIIRSSPELIDIYDRIYTTWVWIESKLQLLPPQVIEYGRIPQIIPGVTTEHVKAFMMNITMNKSTEFVSVSSFEVRIKTELDCYNIRKTKDAITMAGHTGIPIELLMREDVNMPEYIRVMKDKGEIVIYNRRVYSKSMTRKAKDYEGRFKSWDILQTGT